jgi:hypothetical protein
MTGNAFATLIASSWFWRGLMGVVVVVSAVHFYRRWKQREKASKLDIMVEVLAVLLLMGILLALSIPTCWP